MLLCIHVINFKEASGRFFFHFLEGFEKCNNISDLGDAESGVPGRVKSGPDANNSLPRIPADA